MQLQNGEHKSLNVCAGISMTMLALYFADIIIMGTGVLTRFGPISARILFFALAIAFAIPVMLRRLGRLIRNPYLIAVAAFLLWMAVSAVRGYLAGNPMNVLKSDAKGYLNYAILPVMLCVLDSEDRIHKMMKVVIASSLLVALASVALSFFVYYPNAGEIYYFCDHYGLCGITKLYGSAVRVFFHTGSRYFLVAYLFSLYFCCRESSASRRVMWMGAMTLLLFGIFISYSRGIYASAFLGVIALLMLQFFAPIRDRKKLIVTMLISAGCVLIFIGALSLIQKTNLLAVALDRVLEIKGLLGPEQVEAVLEEDMTMEEAFTSGLTRQYELLLLGQSIALSPIIGHGLGKTVPPYEFVEYSYHDIINKAGIIGLILMLVPAFIMIWQLLRGKKRGSGVHSSAWLLSLSAMVSVGYFLFIAYSNPCMNTTVGISCCCLCMALVSYYMKRPESQSR